MNMPAVPALRSRLRTAWRDLGVVADALAGRRYRGGARKGVAPRSAGLELIA